MVCYDKVTETEPALALVERLWRQILCSNELGLHFARMDELR